MTLDFPLFFQTLDFPPRNADSGIKQIRLSSILGVDNMEQQKPQAGYIATTFAYVVVAWAFAGMVMVKPDSDLLTKALWLLSMALVFGPFALKLGYYILAVALAPFFMLLNAFGLLDHGRLLGDLVASFYDDRKL